MILSSIRPSLRATMAMLAGLLAVSSFAAEAQPAPTVTVSGNTGLWSRYMWRGLRVSNAAVWQSTLTAAHGSGVSVSLWKNYDFDTDRLNEIDGTLDYAFSAGGAACNLGWNHFGVIDAADSDELYLLAAWTKGAWTLSAAVYADVNYGKGAYTQAGLSRLFSLGDQVGLKLAANAGAVWKNSFMGLNDRGEEFNDLFSGELVATLPITLSGRFTLEPKLGYTFPLSSNARQAISGYGYGTSSTTLYGTLQLNFSF